MLEDIKMNSNFKSDVFIKRFAELREEKGESNRDLQEAFGLSLSAIINYQTGKRTPDIAFLHKLAEHYNVSADYLLGLSDVKSTEQDMKIACEITGLSEKSINTLRFFHNLKQTGFRSEIIFYDEIDVINMLLLQEYNTYNCECTPYFSVLKDGTNNALHLIANIMNLKYTNTDRLIIDTDGNIKKYNRLEHGCYENESGFYNKLIEVNSMDLIECVLIEKLKQSLKKISQEDTTHAQHNPEEE